MFRFYCLCLLHFLAINTSFAQEKQPPVSITPLTSGFYLFTTWNKYNDSFFPANGLYAVTNKGVVMIDSPWDTSQAVPLLDSIEMRHHQKVVLCLATHYHDDRTGSFQQLNNSHVATWSSAMTQLYCIKNNEPVASHVFLNDTTFQIGDLKFETYYPGPGHSPDNIVVWFPEQKILYGGCMIKSIETSSLGNLSDADPYSWITSIKNIQKKYPSPAFIITGHQRWDSLQSLNHTLKLLSTWKTEK